MRNSRPKKNMRFWKNLILFALLIIFVHYWLKTKSYRFDEKKIIKIATPFSSPSGKIVQQQLGYLINELEEQYPGHILQTQYREWIMIKSGGWVGSVYILHASLTEYLVFTGTALDSQGHSGRHWANITLVLLSGSVKEWKEGTMKAVLHRPGDAIKITWGRAGSFQWKADSWTLEYGRGFTPFSLPFYIADTLFSSFDLVGAFKMLKAFGRAFYFEVISEIADLVASI